ncbi:hypothetical protein Pmar_PMAR009443 [Perkinsus marinus ATCC 50983]|uniref:Uncharacterized protein n=1 Tax=Perkinsus marinus (strain ATCC 50983 / TXsc) TaxID=423536 RepID=C5KSP2_PERM5|nr:hypothetical protein Pmar_PMAR009443 [Perkinsus marinus ATCC 50983]EER12501.1 hypothetical protein Pmar_PMAR009443 [Perkinsus marinus ATCC 50983]|eukprot:XP_002780706.1 hypothetical protein Pmar_PMAR009443 [Perkinsus marinus ATCC 50983]
MYDDIQGFTNRDGPVRQLLPSLPSPPSGRYLASEADDVKQFIGTCLDPAGNGDILSAITVSDGKTLRDTFNVEDRIKTEFDKITASVGASINDPSLDIANLPAFKDLLNAIDAVGDLYVLDPDRAIALQSDANYQWDGSAPPTPSAGAAILEAGFAGVAECSNRTIDLSALSPLFRDPLAFLDGKTLIGVDEYITTLGSNGVNLGTATGCATFKTTGATQNLVPWGNLLNLLKPVMIKTDFYCTGYLISETADLKFLTSPDVPRICDYNQWQQFIRDFKADLLANAL